MDYTVVTVAHTVDLPLLTLQARSLCRHLDRQFVKQIILIDNSVATTLPLDQLLPCYGGLPVTVLLASQVADLPPDLGGWYTQQILKLLVSQHVGTQRYILLDAKNHFISACNQSVFEMPDGRIHTSPTDYTDHPLRPFLVNCCRYFEVPVALILSRFMPTITPFCMVTELVGQLIDTIQRREQQPFVTTFCRRHLTEFFLYSLYLRTCGCLDQYYTFGTNLSTSLWRSSSNAHMQEWLGAVSTACLSIHRSSFQNMDDKTRHMLAGLWHLRELFATQQDALQFIEHCAETYGERHKSSSQGG